MALFLRAHERRKDGKVHTYWSLVENRRCADGRVAQRHVLYLGALTDAQELSWEKTAQQFDAVPETGPALPGLASERELQAKESASIAVYLNQFRIERPRQWGACWVALTLWHFLKLTEFWSTRLPPSREGTRWLNVLITLVVYRLIDPGSECVWAPGGKQVPLEISVFDGAFRDRLKASSDTVKGGEIVIASCREIVEISVVAG